MYNRGSAAVRSYVPTHLARLNYPVRGFRSICQILNEVSSSEQLSADKLATSQGSIVATLREVSLSTVLLSAVGCSVAYLAQPAAPILFNILQDMFLFKLAAVSLLGFGSVAVVNLIYGALAPKNFIPHNALTSPRSIWRGLLLVLLSAASAVFLRAQVLDHSDVGMAPGNFMGSIADDLALRSSSLAPATEKLAMMIPLVLLAPLAEELLFRKAILGRMAASSGLFVAVLMSSLLFAAYRVVPKAVAEDWRLRRAQEEWDELATELALWQHQREALELMQKQDYKAAAAHILAAKDRKATRDLYFPANEAARTSLEALLKANKKVKQGNLAQITVYVPDPATGDISSPSLKDISAKDKLEGAIGKLKARDALLRPRFNQLTADVLKSRRGQVMIKPERLAMHLLSEVPVGLSFATAYILSGGALWVPFIANSLTKYASLWASVSKR